MPMRTAQSKFVPWQFNQNHDVNWQVKSSTEIIFNDKCREKRSYDRYLICWSITEFCCHGTAIVKSRGHDNCLFKMIHSLASLLTYNTTRTPPPELHLHSGSSAYLFYFPFRSSRSTILTAEASMFVSVQDASILAVFHQDIVRVPLRVFRRQ